jgi:DNA polymerase
VQNNEIDHILSSAERYLRQQDELFGGPLYTAPAGSPAGASAPAATEPWQSAATLDELNAQICTCLKCPLGETRTKFVFGVGNPSSRVVFIGEAPGADEDAQGEPFVGRAGQLLNKILEAVDLKREEVYICNILKCRPPNNRAPLPEESESCTPYLMKQLGIIKPQFIICLGRTAAQWLLKTQDTLGAMRGKVHEYHGIKLIVTYHPAALLRNPDWKRPTWEDMKMFKKLFDESRP